MVRITESVVLAARLEVREHDSVLTVQIHPPAGSLIAVTVSCEGSVKLSTAEASVGFVPLFTLTVN
jgi:hypothetical protein